MNKSTWILLGVCGSVLLGSSSAVAVIEKVNLEFSPYAGALVVDEQLDYTENVSALVGDRLGIALSPRIAFEAQGGWSRFEVPATDAPVQRDLGLASGGLAFDLTGHRHVRPFVTIGGGYAEDMTTDADGSVADPFAQVGGGLKIVGNGGLGVRLEAWQVTRDMTGCKCLNVPTMVDPVEWQIGLFPMALNKKQLMRSKCRCIHDDLPVQGINSDFFRVLHQIRHMMSTEYPNLHDNNPRQEMFICLKLYGRKYFDGACIDTTFLLIRAMCNNL